MSFSRHSQTVNVSRQRLLEVLAANKVQHIIDYNDAVAGFKDEMIRVLKEQLAKAESGELTKLQLILPQPESHEREYQEAIDMLEFSVDENIQLDSDLFRAYCKNEWSWSNSFNTLVGNYKGAAGSLR